ncbi:hypothetical protein Tco_1366204, partial [Tanacetum coccineum]
FIHEGRVVDANYDDMAYLSAMFEILGLPTEGHCSFTDNWSLDSLALSTHSRGPYLTDPPSPDLIKAYIQLDKLEPLTRIHKGSSSGMSWSHSLLYRVLNEYNLAFFVAKQMEFVRRQPRMILPYGMFLSRLYHRVMSNFLELSSDQYVLFDRVMYPLAP